MEAHVRSCIRCWSAGGPGADRAWSGAPRPARQTFRSALDVVTVHASVRDRRGRLITGLNPRISRFATTASSGPSSRSGRTVSLPIALAIVVDISGSMRLSGKAQMARDAYAMVLSQLHPQQDEAAVFTFDKGLHERRPFTRQGHYQPPRRADRVRGIRRNVCSTMRRQLGRAKKLAARTGSHKAMMVLTDGTDTSSTMTAREVSAMAASIDVPVYVVTTVPSSEQREMVEGGTRKQRESPQSRRMDGRPVGAPLPVRGRDGGDRGRVAHRGPSPPVPALNRSGVGSGVAAPRRARPPPGNRRQGSARGISAAEPAKGHAAVSAGANGGRRRRTRRRRPLRKPDMIRNVGA